MRGRSAGCDDDGRILLLTLVFVLFAVALTGMVASASAVHLDRRQLAGLSDMLAAHAAQAVSESRMYEGMPPVSSPGEGLLILGDAGVAAAVDEYLAAHPGVAPDGLVVTDASSPDGRSARVGLAAPSSPPFLSWFTDAVAPITVTASSLARAW